MVCVPVGWGEQRNVYKKHMVPKVGELVGGYLNPGTYNMSLPFRLLTTKGADPYYALFNTRRSYEQLCGTLTLLQSVGFMINSEALSFLEENRERLVKLMPTNLS